MMNDNKSTTKTIAKIVRKKFYYQNLEPLCVEDVNMFPSTNV